MKMFKWLNGVIVYNEFENLQKLEWFSSLFQMAQDSQIIDGCRRNFGRKLSLSSEWFLLALISGSLETLKCVQDSHKIQNLITPLRMNVYLNNVMTRKLMCHYCINEYLFHLVVLLKSGGQNLGLSIRSTLLIVQNLVNAIIDIKCQMLLLCLIMLIEIGEPQLPSELTKMSSKRRG